MEKMVLSGAAYCGRYIGFCPDRYERDDSASNFDTGKGNGNDRPPDSYTQADIEGEIDGGA